jgi:hypothetical protein
MYAGLVYHPVQHLVTCSLVKLVTLVQWWLCLPARIRLESRSRCYHGMFRGFPHFFLANVPICLFKTVYYWLLPITLQFILHYNDTVMLFSVANIQQYIYIYIYVCVCVCVYRICTHTHTHTHTHPSITHRTTAKTIFLLVK